MFVQKQASVQLSTISLHILLIYLICVSVLQQTSEQHITLLLIETFVCNQDIF